jgi:colanic acid biosynthesis glycosyl transferase WcaI
VLVWRSLRRLLQRNDIVVAMTDPPLLSIVATPVTRQRGAFLVNWLQDIYPELAIELGVPLIKGPVRRLLCHLRDRGLQAARCNVVVGKLMADKIASRRV